MTLAAFQMLCNVDQKHYFSLYVSHDVSRMMLITCLCISWRFVVLSDYNSTFSIFTSRHCIKHKRMIEVIASASCFKIKKLHPLLVFPAELESLRF